MFEGTHQSVESRRATRGRAKRDSREIKNTSVFDCTTFNRVRLSSRVQNLKVSSHYARLLEKIRRAFVRLASPLLLARLFNHRDAINLDERVERKRLHRNRGAGRGVIAKLCVRVARC